MTLDTFPFKLLDGTEILVDAEVTEDDCLIGLTFPIGCRLESALRDAYIQHVEIEERAVEIYRDRLRENREAV